MAEEAFRVAVTKGSRDEDKAGNVFQNGKVRLFLCLAPAGKTKKATKSEIERQILLWETIWLIIFWVPPLPGQVVNAFWGKVVNIIRSGAGSAKK